MNRLTETDLIQEICTRLDASVADLPPVLDTRLDRMRELALESLQQPENTTLRQETHQLLNSSLALPPEIESRLDAARRQAIGRHQARNNLARSLLGVRPGSLITTWLDPVRLNRPANMLATACVLVTVVSLFYVSSRPQGTLPVEEEMSLIASADDFELYENLDFYLWLAENGLPN